MVSHRLPSGSVTIDPTECMFASAEVCRKGPALTAERDRVPVLAPTVAFHSLSRSRPFTPEPVAVLVTARAVYTRWLVSKSGATAMLTSPRSPAPLDGEHGHLSWN